MNKLRLVVVILLIGCSKQPNNENAVSNLTEEEITTATVEWFKGLYISRIDTVEGKKLPVILISIKEDFTGTSYFDQTLSYGRAVSWKIPQGDFTWSPDLSNPKPGTTITCTWPNGETILLGYMQKKEYIDPLSSTMLWTPGANPDGESYMRKIGYKVTDEFMKQLQPKSSTNSSKKS